MNLTKQKDTENKSGVVSRKRDGGETRYGEGVRRYKLLFVKSISHKNILDSIENTVNIL